MIRMNDHDVIRIMLEKSPLICGLEISTRDQNSVESSFKNRVICWHINEKDSSILTKL